MSEEKKDDKGGGHHEEKKPNPGVLALIWLASVGGGLFIFTFLYKMAMENLQHGGTSWAFAKDDLISFSIGIGIFSLVVRFAIIQPIIDYYDKKAAAH